MRKETMGLGLAMGLLLGGMSVSASAITVGEGLSTSESPISQLQLTKNRIKKLFAGKKFYYIDWHLKDHPIIGVAEFDDSMEEMKYREIIGGKKHGSVDLVLRKDGFSVLWPTKRYVKVRKIRKGFIETNSKKLFRFYKSKKAAQTYLTRRGYDVLPPKIELLGENPLKIEQYHPYIEAGAIATDKMDGNVTVSIRGKVDIDRLGNYTVIYRARDFSGNVAVKRRKVEIVPTDDQIWHVSNVEEFRRALEDATLNGADDIVMLDRGVYRIDADGQGTFKYNDSEEYNVTIRAAAHLPRSAVVLDGNFSDRILWLSNQAHTTITLMNLTLRNGKTQEQGGAVYSQESLRLINTAFTQNEAVKEGGAVWLAEDATLLSIDSSFVKNLSHKEGGGFYIRSGSPFPDWVHIIHSQFLQNEAVSGHGGGFAAINYDHRSSVVVEKSLFRANQARFGGGFSFRYGDTVVDKSRFYDNHAEAGGALWAYTLDLNGSVFRRDSSELGGGAIYAHDAVLNADIIVDNESGDQGGGIWADYLRMANTLLQANTTENEGASLYVRYDGYLVNNTLIDNNGSAYFRREAILLNNVFQNPKSDWELQMGSSGVIVNNYLEESDIDEEGGYVIKKANLQPSEVGPLHFVHGYIPTAKSPTVDRGLTPDSELFEQIIKDAFTLNFFENALQRDLKGGPRYLIDIGAVEYRLKKK